MFFRDRNPGGTAARTSMDQFAPNFRSAEERKFDRSTSTLPTVEVDKGSSVDAEAAKAAEAALIAANADEFLFADSQLSSAPISEDERKVDQSASSVRSDDQMTQSRPSGGDTDGLACSIDNGQGHATSGEHG